jgi:outer membrane beta-barrel protein
MHVRAKHLEHIPQARDRGSERSRTRSWPRPALILCLLTWVCLIAPTTARAVCPEPPETEEGSRKGLSKRQFIKSLRHEINLFGGVYASDLMGAAPLGGLSYSFHLSEDFAVEAAFAYSYFSSSLTKPVKQYTGYTVLTSHDARIYSGNLVWHPIHGKFMLFQSSIPHFDIFFTAGVGVTDSRTAKGLTYNFGTGLKIFSTSWLSLRLDIRDYIYVQEVLGRESVTNNISVTLGVGFWIPFSN